MNVFVILSGLLLIGVALVHATLRREHARRFDARFVGVIMLVYATALFGPARELYFAVLFVGFVGLCAGRRHALSYYVVVSCLVANVSMPLVVAGSYLFAFNALDVLALGFFAASFLQPDGARPRPPRGFTAEDFAVVATFLLIGVGTPHVTAPGALARGVVQEALIVLLPYAAVRRGLDGPEALRELLRALVVSGILVTVFALYEFQFGWYLFRAMETSLGDVGGGMRDLRGGLLRTSAAMSGPLMLACWMSLAWTATLCSRGAFRNLPAWLAAVGFATLGLLAPQSRGSLACLAIAAIAIPFYRGRRAQAALTVGAAAAGYVALKVFGSAAGYFAVGGAAADYGVYDYRNLLLQRGIEEVMRHRWTGDSYLNVLDALADIQQGQHIVDLVNVYLVVALLTGLIGLALFAGPLILSLIKTCRSDRAVAARGLTLVKAAAVSLFAAIALQLAFMSFIDRLPLMFALTLALNRALPLVARRAPARLSAAESETAPAAPARHSGRLAAAVAARALPRDAEGRSAGSWFREKPAPTIGG